MPFFILSKGYDKKHQELSGDFVHVVSGYYFVITGFVNNTRGVEL